MSNNFLELGEWKVQNSPFDNPNLFQNVLTVTTTLNPSFLNKLARLIPADIFPFTSTTSCEEYPYITSFHLTSFMKVDPTFFQAAKCLQQIVIDDKYDSIGASFILEDMNNLKSVTIGTNCLNHQSCQSFVLTNLPLLKTVVIGSQSFGNVRDVKITDLQSLSTIEIGRNTFSYANTSKTASVQLNALPQLHVLAFENQSFMHYPAPVLTQLPELQSLCFGDDCFGGSSDHSVFLLTGLTALKTVKFGMNSFYLYSHCAIQSLSSLDSISFGMLSFGQSDGDGGLIVKSCNQLRLIDMSVNCFHYACALLFEGMSMILTVYRRFGSVANLDIRSLGSVQKLHVVYPIE